MTTTPTKPGLSLFEVPPRADDAAAAFETVLSNAAFAEQLGFETYWLAEGHFSDIGSPSALTLLAALSQRTTRLRLGTAVIPLAFDNPLRVAETAAVVNSISGDRLELGVGKGNPGGFSAAAYHAFGLDEAQRESLYAATLDRLREAFAHTETGSGGRTFGFYPPAAGLPDRIWQATSRIATAREIGRSGDALQLHRVVFGGDTGQAQRELVDAYLEHLPSETAPRIGVSRSVLPARDAAEAVELFARHLETNPLSGVGVEPGEDPVEVLERLYVLYGTPEQIVERLHEDAAVVASTDYLFNVPLDYADPSYHRTLTLIADEIYPHLPVAQYGRLGVIGSVTA